MREKRRQLFGPEHPDAIAAALSLATIYQKQGRCEEAEALQIEVLELQRRILVRNHPDIIMAARYGAHQWFPPGSRGTMISIDKR